MSNSKPQTKQLTGGKSGYASHREAAGRRQAAQSRAGRDIGEIPAVQNPRRRKACSKSLKRHCETYHPDQFFLPWSKDHLTAIDRSERACRHGELFGMAMARGSGKTMLAKGLAEWAALNGYCRFIPLIGFDIGDAVEMLHEIKQWLEENDLLLADYPEVCYPIRRMEGIAQRKLLYKGAPVGIEWHAREISLPMIPDSAAAGCCIRACGLLSRLRGMTRRGVRPDFFVANDIQSDQSARSPHQIAKRLGVLRGAVLGLAGPGKTIGGILTSTVLCSGDVADQILDAKRHPEWKGLRTAMMESMPADLAAWERYYEVYRACMSQTVRDFGPANKYYRAHRLELDRGATPSWPARKGADVSAILHAMNIRAIIGNEAFDSEYQNAPQTALQRSGLQVLTPGGLADRLNGMERRVLSPKVQTVTIHVDVGDALLWWLAAGWQPDFTGQVVDYGTHPKQPVRYFSKREPPRKLSHLYPRAGKEGAVLAGLTELVDALVKIEFKREDGAVLRVGRILIDARYDRDLVVAFCRRSVAAALLMPAMGFYMPKGRSWSVYWLGREGGQTGFHWRIPPAKGGGRYVLTDSNYWKTLAFERLRVSQGDPGAWTVFGRDPAEHAMLFDHLCAEKPVWTVAKDLGRFEWERQPGCDNDWWDNLYNCAVAAAMLGVRIPGIETGRLRRDPANRPTAADLAGRGRQ